MGAARDYIARRYGRPVATNELVVVLNAAAPVVVLPNNPNRLAWTIFNLGAAVGYLGFTAAVAALNGIQIAAAGGVIGVNATDDGELPTRQIYGLGAGATTLYILETVAL